MAEYSPRFTDAVYWRPLVDEVCRRHDLARARQVRAGLAGTFPVFIVDDQYVVKLYGDLFGGPAAFAVEREALRLLADGTHLPVPRVVAQGRLFVDGEAWSWPYLVISYLPGISLGEAAPRLPLASRLQLASSLGCLVGELHRLPLPFTGALAASWDPFMATIGRRRAAAPGDHARWNDLPAGLIEQINGYLLPDSDLIDRSHPPCLVQADLNADHLLGRLDEDGWHTTGLIDFGDARAGDPVYELVALHLGLFLCDKRLLKAFLAAYSPPLSASPLFVRRAMSYTLLFEFGLGDTRTRFPALDQVATLDRLGQLIWDLESPALSGTA